jgi:hypothetical protein
MISNDNIRKVGKKLPFGRSFENVLRHTIYQLYYKNYLIKNNIQENRLLILATIARSGTHYMMILLSNYINYISGGNRSIGPSDMNKMLPNNWHLSYMSYRNIPFGPYHVNSIVTPDKRLKFLGLSDITRSHSIFQKVFWKNGNILHLYRNPLDYSVSLFNYKHKKRIGKKNPANSPQEVLNEKFANYVEMYKSYIEATNSGKYKIFRLPYELLIKDPEYYLYAVLTWLGIDPKKEIISRAVLTSSIKNVKKAEETGAKVNPAAKDLKGSFISSGKIGQWKKYYNNSDYNYWEKKFSNHGIDLNAFILEP